MSENEPRVHRLWEDLHFIVPSSRQLPRFSSLHGHRAAMDRLDVSTVVEALDDTDLVPSGW